MKIMSMSKIRMLFWWHLKKQNKECGMCLSFLGIVFVHLLVRFQRFLSLCFFGYVGHNKYWRGSEVSETAEADHLASVSVCARVDCAGHFVVSWEDFSLVPWRLRFFCAPCSFCRAGLLSLSSMGSGKARQ